MKNSYKKIIIGIVVVIVISLSIKKTITLNENRKLIDSNSVTTIGFITDYYEIGIANYYLEYDFYIEGVIYQNKVIPKKLFKDCQIDRNCINQKIYIKYYRENPSISEPIYDIIPK